MSPTSWQRVGVEALDAGVALVSGGILVHLNEAAARLLGRSVDEAVGMQVGTLLAGTDDDAGHPVTQESSVSADVLRTGRPTRRVRRIPRADGPDVWVVVTGRPTTYDGAPAVVLTISEVTAEREAQLAAEAGGRRLQQILDAVDASVFTKDREGRYTFVNRAFLDALGQPAADVLGRRTTELAARLQPGAAEVGPDEEPEGTAAERQDERLFTTGAPVSDVLHSAGRSYLTTKRPLRDGAGRVEGMVGVSTDVTAQVRAMEAQAIANAVVESTTDSIVTFGPDLVITGCNTAAALLHSRPALDLVGRGYGEVLTGAPDRDKIEDLLRPTLDGEGSELELTDPLGRVFALRAFPIRAGDGQIIGGAVMGRDISERHAAETRRRELERQLEHLQRLEGLGQLAGGIAHDVNNMVAAVRLTAELLAGQLPEGSEQRGHAASIVSMTTRAAAFTQQLLVFARKDTGHLRRVDVNAAVRQADALLVRSLGAGIARLLELTPGELVVEADPAQLEAVLVNLAINARDAMPDGGSLRIRTSVEELTDDGLSGLRTGTVGRHALITVSDDGVGMDEQTRAQAFDPFFTTKPTGQGTGLGLSMAYGMAHQAGGGAWIYSEPGHGTVVKVALPLVAAASGRAMPAAVPPAAVRGGTGQRIALVEDEPALREVGRRILDRAGYQVATFEDGPALLAALESSGAPPDLLLTDVMLPHLPGPELAAELRRRHPEMAVLFMSGYTAGLLGRQVEQAEVLEKPFPGEQLLAAVARALAGRPDPGADSDSDSDSG